MFGVIQDELFHKAVLRTPLTTQQLTSMAVVSSSLFLRHVPFSYLSLLAQMLCTTASLNQYVVPVVVNLP